MANQTLAFALILTGIVVLDAGIKGDSIANVVQGKATQHPLTTPAGDKSGGTTSSGQIITGNAFSKDATGSRLDMGQDLTSTQFNTPVSGRIVKSVQSDPGWAGGGYVALLLDNPIRLADGTVMRALYWAEGIAPSVNDGQHVSAGQQIGLPVINPYNGTRGNIEWGPASTSGEPLAKAVSNAAAMVRAWYKWALSVGAPSASSTSNAGFP